MKRSTLLGAAVAVLLAGVCLASGLTPATSSAYTARITNNTDTAATAAFFTCTAADTADRAAAYFQYPLNEATNATAAADKSANAVSGTYQGSMTTSATTPLACPRDTAGAYVLNGSTSFVSTPTSVTSPATFTLEVWFKTAVAAGKLMGFENQQTGLSGQYDRQIYLSPTGQVIFGTYNGAAVTIASSTTVNYANSAWHHVVATFSAATGMILYVDGRSVAANATYTTAESHAGYWRVGFGNLSGWPTPGTNNYFTGSMRFAAAYTTAFTATQVANHYNAGR